MTVALDIKTPATLFYLSAFGIQAIPVREIKAEFVEFAQYKNAVRITYLRQRKRKYEGTVKGYKPWFVIVEGHEIEEIADSTMPVVGGTLTRHSSFDTAWETEANEYIAKLKNKVLFKSE